MQRYEKYKDSGVEWIGEIPEGWKIYRMANLGKFSASGIDKLSLPNQSKVKIINYTDVYKNQKRVINSDIDFMEVTTPEHNRLNNLVKKGDLIFLPSSETFEDLGLSALIEEDLENVSFSYHVLRFQFSIEVYDNYKKYFTNNHSILGQFSSNGTGSIRKTLNRNDFRNLNVVLPPIEEQQTIANFLDDKTAKIDQTIAIKQKEIELLKERRQILIQKAVTKGLDATVPMKDSGVDWIGEIPEHWEVRKLKYCLNSKLKYGANESGVEYDLDLPRYIRITDFGFDGKLSEDKKLSLTWLQGKDYLLKDGDILFARSGATVGKSYQFKTSMSFEKHYSFAGYLIKAEANEEIILSDYLYLYTNSNLFGNWKSAIFNKATIENIGADKYSTLSVVVPPVIEQKEILLEYNTKNEKIAKAISIKEQEIEKLKEYKTVLIDQVVTGKVKIN